MNYLTQKPTCKSFGRQRSEQCKFCKTWYSGIFFLLFSLQWSQTLTFSLYFSNIRSQVQDPLVLLDPACLGEALLEWLPVLERILGPADVESAAADDSNLDGSGEERWDYLNLCSEQQGEPSEDAKVEKKESPGLGEEAQCDDQQKFDSTENVTSGSPPEPVRVASPKPVPADLLANLTELATLYTELSCFTNQIEALRCTTFLRRYFFLLDQKRVRRMCLLCYKEQPEMKSSFTEAMIGQKPVFQSCDCTKGRKNKE